MRQKTQEGLEHVSVYVPKSILKRIAELAEKERRSISSEIVILLEKILASQGGHGPDKA